MHENCCDANKERINRRLVDLSTKLADEVGHHVFGAAIEDIRILHRGILPIRSRTRSDNYVGAITGVERLGAVSHCRPPATWSIHVDRQRVLGSSRCSRTAERNRSYAR